TRTKLLWLAHLADIAPTHRLRSVRSSPKPLREVQKVSLKFLPIVPPRLAVYACGRLSLQTEVGRSQTLNAVHMVQERSEPLSLIPPCCLTYPLKRAGHAAPALNPGPVTLGRLSLGQSPSLHHLLGLRPSLVRRLLRYNGTVRLPVPVHHRGTSLDFPLRSALPSLTDRHGISRLPLKVLACMLRVSDRAGSKGVSRLRRLQSCLPLSSTASAPQSGHRWRDGGSISRLHTWPVRTPVNASLAPLRTKMHDSESARVASPSLYESFIHNTLPALTGALNFERVGVGIMVAHNPLHGSGRAGLLHPALASGNDAKAYPRIRMTDACMRKPPCNLALHPSPGQMTFLAAPFEHSPPDSSQCHAKVTDRHCIHRHSVVTHMAKQNRAHIGTHLGHGLMHTPTKLGLDSSKLRLPPRAHRLSKHRKPSLARLSATVRESQEVKGLGLALTSALPVFFRMPAEL